ncbi:MAG: hypothetical protein JXC36_07940 [Candidatus Atribacteria bacterium]|nr:hypothetical protein [Candidatus Atribacteria bacterium]
MSTYFPVFLQLDLTIWGILILLFVGFTIYISNKPANFIEKSKAQAIENKKRLGIKIYRLR